MSPRRSGSARWRSATRRCSPGRRNTLITAELHAERAYRRAAARHARRPRGAPRVPRRRRIQAVRAPRIAASKRATPASRATTCRNTFIITIDGEEVYRADIGGPDDHAAQAKSMNDVRPIIDARMTARVKVTAGPHDVGFTFQERPAQRQDVWVPSQRDSQEIHFTGGPAEAEDGRHRGPLQRHRRQPDAEPRAPLRLHAEDGRGGRRACAKRILLNLASVPTGVR